MTRAVVVRFNSVAEFMAELVANPMGTIKLVRVTRQWRSTSMMPLRSLSLVATFIDQEGSLVRLDLHCGETMHAGDHADQRADRACEDLVGALHQQGCHVRAGIFELPAGCAS